MDKVQIVITETFRSDTEMRRKENLQCAVDQYIRLMLKNCIGDQPDTPEEDGKRPRSRGGTPE